ncbi:MAG: hypothetical protein PWQ61_2638 [Betaproteobacteria bacterium]|nr:hypothetical protein [Betaproteobacteria bacterium]
MSELNQADDSDDDLYPDDETSSLILKTILELAGFLKAHFCIAFGSHQYLVDVLELYLENPGFYPRALADMLESEDFDVTKAPKELAAFIYSKLDGKNPSQALMKARVELLLSAAMNSDAFAHLECGRKEEALRTHTSSSVFFGSYLGSSYAEFGSRSIRSMALLGAETKLLRDPRQQEKEFVRDAWQDWQKKLDRYPSSAAFARDMLDKTEHLKSQAVIERWCRDWKKELGTLPDE